MRKPYILYRRQAGKKTKPKRELPYYVAFWDEERRKYRDRRCTGQTNERYARMQAEKWLAEGIPSSSTETFRAYLARFWNPDGEYAKISALRGRKLSAGYLNGKRTAIIKHVLPYLDLTGQERLTLTMVTPAMLEDLILYLANTIGLSAVRINDIRKALNVPLSEALRLGKIHHNPMVGVLRLKEERPKRETLTLEEARRFFNLEWQDPHLQLINMLAAATGMRLGECRGLQRTDVVQDGANYEFRICHNWLDGEGLKAPKWNSVRTVPIPAKIAEALLQLADSNPWKNGFVFAGYNETRAINKHQVEKSFNDAVHRIGISEEERRRRKLTFHSWRHWYPKIPPFYS
jgi:integrase